MTSTVHSLVAPKSDEGGSNHPLIRPHLRALAPSLFNSADVTMQLCNHVTLPFARPAVLWSCGPTSGNHFCTILHHFSRFRSAVSFFINHLRSQFAPPVQFNHVVLWSGGPAP